MHTFFRASSSVPLALLAVLPAAEPIEAEPPDPGRARAEAEDDPPCFVTEIAVQLCSYSLCRSLKFYFFQY